MKKVIYSNLDIQNEFVMCSRMRNIPNEVIEKVLNIIEKDNFKLVQTKKYMGTKRCNIYMCEWYEDGQYDSDEWVQTYYHFLTFICKNYIIEAKRLSNQCSYY